MSETEAPKETPYVDPQMVPVLKRMIAAMTERPPGEATPREMRARFAEDVAVWNVAPVDLPRIEDRMVPGPFADVRVRLYAPAVQDTHALLPGLIFFHGGGWVVGSPESVEGLTRLLAKLSGAAVLSVDYGLAPERRFPEQPEECLAVSRWLHRNAWTWGIDVQNLAIGGDSAGANLALSTALALRDMGETWLRAALLIYGVYSADSTTPSHRRFGRGEYGFGSEAMNMLWSLYAPDEAQRHDPRAAPLRAGLHDLPPLHLVTAGLDPLRDDSRLLAGKVIAAGGDCDYREYPGVIHGFMTMINALDIAGTATREAARFLRAVLTPENDPDKMKG